MGAALFGGVDGQRRADLGEAGKSLVGRLEGPAGLDIGGRGAAAIALSLVAGLQGYLSGRRGDSD